MNIKFSLNSCNRTGELDAGCYIEIISIIIGSVTREMKENENFQANFECVSCATGNTV